MPALPKRKKRAPSSIEFNHAMVYRRDLAPALRFYADVLGFKVIEQFGAGYARLRSPRGQTTLALHVAEPEKEPPRAEGVRLYFETTDLDDVCAALEASGTVLTQPPRMMPWGWRHAYVDDPDGHEISLYWAGRKRFRKTRC